MKKLPLGKDCFVSSITLVFLKKFGYEALDWDPLIVREAFEGGFGVQKMSQRMFDKLNCGLALVGTDTYTSTIEGFLTGTAVMNNQVLESDMAPFVTLSQCAWGIWEYINLNGDVDQDSRPTEQFSPDIAEYIRQVGNTVGVSEFPVWMDFANPEGDAVPDLSDDVDLYEQYRARQQDYISDLNAYVNARQAKLTEELKTLANDGFIG